MKTKMKKVGFQALRSMRYGETRTFFCGDYAGVRSARQMASTARKLDECVYATRADLSVPGNYTITIRKERDEQ